MFILGFFILFFIEIHGKYLFNPSSSSFLVVRHVHLLTNDKQYQIQCPYYLNHLKLQLLNYSNDNCFNLYSSSYNNACKTHYSPCKFHAKSIPIHCDYHSYSKYVDITYQCSYQYIKKTFSQSIISQNETISIFLVSFGIIITMSIFFCCIWFICCYNQDDDDDDDDAINDKNSQLVPHRSYSKDNFSLTINPFENKCISSLRTIQSV